MAFDCTPETPLRQRINEFFRKDLEEAVERFRVGYGLSETEVAAHLADLVPWYGVRFSTCVPEKESA